MSNIVFIDTEIDQKSHRILDIGAIKSDEQSFHSNSINDFERFLTDTDFICGHNILIHDLKYLQNSQAQRAINSKKVIEKWNEHIAGTRNWQYQLWPILIYQSWKKSLIA